MHACRKGAARRGRALCSPRRACHLGSAAPPPPQAPPPHHRQPRPEPHPRRQWPLQAAPPVLPTCRCSVCAPAHHERPSRRRASPTWLPPWLPVPGGKQRDCRRALRRLGAQRAVHLGAAVRPADPRAVGRKGTWIWSIGRRTDWLSSTRQQRRRRKRRQYRARSTRWDLYALAAIHDESV